LKEYIKMHLAFFFPTPASETRYLSASSVFIFGKKLGESASLSLMMRFIISRIFIDRCWPSPAKPIARLILPAEADARFDHGQNSLWRARYAVSNPTRDVPFLKEGSGSTRVVSFDEEIAYMSHASQPLKDIAQFILDCGLRPEEVFRIKLENLDFADRSIFNPFGKTKTSQRRVTMTAAVRELPKLRATKAKGQFIFPSKNDPNRHIGSIRKTHDRAVKNAGISERFCPMSYATLLRLAQPPLALNSRCCRPCSAIRKFR
jgi:integrase